MDILNEVIRTCDRNLRSSRFARKRRCCRRARVWLLSSAMPDTPLV